MQLMPGLYQVGGSLGGLTVAGSYLSPDYRDANAYALQGDEGIVLLDCGNGQTLPQIFENMQAWGLSPGDIRACLLTHAHWDHAGAAHLLARRGVALYAHTQTAAALKAGDERCAGYLYHQTFQPCDVNHCLEDGQQFELLGIAFEAMHLPGHTMGCTVYRFKWRGKEVLLSGDVIGTLLGGYFGWDGSIDFNKGLYLASLQRLAKIDTDLMLSGHGLVYFDKPRARVEEVLAEALSQWR